MHFTCGWLIKKFMKVGGSSKLMSIYASSGIASCMICLSTRHKDSCLSFQSKFRDCKIHTPSYLACAWQQCSCLSSTWEKVAICGTSEYPFPSDRAIPHQYKLTTLASMLSLPDYQKWSVILNHTCTAHAQSEKGAFSARNFSKNISEPFGLFHKMYCPLYTITSRL